MIADMKMIRYCIYTSALTLSDGLVSGVATLPASRVLRVKGHFLVIMATQSGFGHTFTLYYINISLRGFINNYYLHLGIS